jgi:hypothetical protein
LATEAQRKVINTDYHQEYGFLADSIQGKMVRLLEMYDDRDISIFDLAQNHGALNWVDKKLTENLDMYDHIIKQRNERAKAQ